MTAHRGRRACHIDAQNTIHLAGERGKKLTLCGLESPPMIKTYDPRLKVTCSACLMKAAQYVVGSPSTGTHASSDVLIAEES